MLLKMLVSLVNGKTPKMVLGIIVSYAEVKNLKNIQEANKDKIYLQKKKI